MGWRAPAALTRRPCAWHQPYGSSGRMGLARAWPMAFHVQHLAIQGLAGTCDLGAPAARHPLHGWVGGWVGGVAKGSPGRYHRPRVQHGVRAARSRGWTASECLRIARPAPVGGGQGRALARAAGRRAPGCVAACTHTHTHTPHTHSRYAQPVHDGTHVTVLAGATHRSCAG